MALDHAPSRKKLLQVHPHLQQLVHAVAERMPLIVVCGHRGKNEQNLAFTTGHSKLAWPYSAHNKLPSHAVDCAPIDEHGKLDWNRIDLFDEMGKAFKQEAERLKIDIKWGGDWQRFKDRPHIELDNVDEDGDKVA